MKDKIVIITGASEGLGKSVAHKLANEGAQLALISHREKQLRQAATELGRNAHPYVCDVTSVNDIHRTTEKILSDFGKIDILINNAGIWTDEELEKTNPDRRKEVFEVNALGTIEFTKALEPTLVKQKHGHVLNVISVAGVDDSTAADNTLWQTYGASKWALAGFTRALKDSLEGTGIKVTGFYPGGFESNLYENAGKTDAHHQPWMMRTEDVADALVFCLKQPADVLVEKIVLTKFSG
jgi:short-subunit dehydrogenase